MMSRLIDIILWLAGCVVIFVFYRLLRGLISSDIIRALIATVAVTGLAILGVVIFGAIRGLFDPSTR